MRELWNARLNASICFSKRIMPIFYKSFISLSNPLGIIVRVRTLEERLRKWRKGRGQKRWEEREN
jgi:hypothetical protein